MITIKEYAAQNGVTYEAVRAQIKRYKKDLDEHIHRQGRVQYLDDAAVAFLNEHRAQNPVSVYNADAVKGLRELEAENRELRQELNVLMRWKSDNAVAIAEAKTQQFLLETSEKEKEKLRKEKEVAEGFIREAKAETERVRAEASEREEQQKKKHFEEVAKLQRELETEKSRKLTFKERIFGVKNDNKNPLN